MTPSKFVEYWGDAISKAFDSLAMAVKRAGFSIGNYGLIDPELLEWWFTAANPADKFSGADVYLRFIPVEEKFIHVWPMIEILMRDGNDEIDLSEEGEVLVGDESHIQKILEKTPKSAKELIAVLQQHLGPVTPTRQIWTVEYHDESSGFRFHPSTSLDEAGAKAQAAHWLEVLAGQVEAAAVSGEEKFPEYAGHAHRTWPAMRNALEKGDVWASYKAFWDFKDLFIESEAFFDVPKEHEEIGNLTVEPDPLEDVTP